MSRVLALLALLAVALVSAGDVPSCLDVKSKDVCKKSQEGPADGQKCVWCAAMAVPSTCVNAERAAGLPEGVFICELNATSAIEPIPARLRYLFN